MPDATQQEQCKNETIGSVNVVIVLVKKCCSRLNRPVPFSYLCHFKDSTIQSVAVRMNSEMYVYFCDEYTDTFRNM
jgi:hypothetical protein